MVNDVPSECCAVPPQWDLEKHKFVRPFVGPDDPCCAIGESKTCGECRFFLEHPLAHLNPCKCGWAARVFLRPGGFRVECINPTCLAKTGKHWILSPLVEEWNKEYAIQPKVANYAVDA